MTAGKAADLLVLAADPTASTTAYRHVRWVARGGELRSLADLQALADRPYRSADPLKLGMQGRPSRHSSGPRPFGVLLPGSSERAPGKPHGRPRRTPARSEAQPRASDRRASSARRSPGGAPPNGPSTTEGMALVS